MFMFMFIWSLLMMMILVLVSLWVIWCNYRTLNDKIRIIDLGAWKFDTVSYHRHWFELSMFRNPWKLYDSKLINHMNNIKGNEFPNNYD